jgi:hypothetical protein
LARYVDRGEWASLAKFFTINLTSLVWMMKAKQPAFIGAKRKLSQTYSSNPASKSPCYYCDLEDDNLSLLSANSTVPEPECWTVLYDIKGWVPIIQSPILKIQLP